MKHWKNTDSSIQADVMKAKRRPVNRRQLRLVIILFALITVPTSLFVVWAGFCSIPKEISLSQKLAQSTLQNVYSEAELVRQIFDEVSWKLAWHGSNTLGYVYFKDECQSGLCTLDSLTVDMAISHFDICTWDDRNVKDTSVFIDIEISGSEVIASLAPGILWSTEAMPTEIYSEIARVKDRVMRSLGAEVWNMYPALTLKFFLYRNSWSMTAYTPDGILIHSEKGDYRL